MQIKTTLRKHFSWIRLANIEKLVNTLLQPGCRETGKSPALLEKMQTGTTGKELMISKNVPDAVYPSVHRAHFLKFTLKIHLQQDGNKYAHGY